MVRRTEDNQSKAPLEAHPREDNRRAAPQVVQVLRRLKARSPRAGNDTNALPRK